MVAKGKRALRSADFFRRVPRDLTEGSAHGGSISLIATALMLFLVFGEFCSYNATKTVTDVYADTTTNSQLRINFDVFFPEVSCEHLSVDVMDVIGNLKSNVTANIKKFAKKTTDDYSGKATSGKRTGWIGVDSLFGPTLQTDDEAASTEAKGSGDDHYSSSHILEAGEESKLVEESNKGHPELVKWYAENQATFKDAAPQDQELIKAAFALALSWEDETYSDEEQVKSVYKIKQASYDITSMDDFNYLADNYNILLVDFHAPWCSHCKKFSPTWETSSYYFNNALYLMQQVYEHKVGDYTKSPPALDLKSLDKKKDNLPKGEILLASVNCVEFYDVCSKHQIPGYPTIRMFKNTKATHDPVHETHINLLTEYTAYKGSKDLGELVKFVLTAGAEMNPNRKDFVSLLVSEPESEEQKRNVDQHLISEKPVVNPEDSNTRDQTEQHTMEGCRLTGYADSSRVPGLVRFTVSGDDTTFDPNLLNMTHEIRSFHFGKQKLEPYMSNHLLKYNQGSPHERGLKLVDDYEQEFVAQKRKLSYQHYIKTVATSMLWVNEGKRPFSTYEMSVNTNEFEHDTYNPKTQPELHQSELPSVVFHYDLSPLQIVIREEKETLFRFLVNLCAIIGGVYTVASMIDGLLHRLTDMAHKLQLGKQT
jgi:thiol-disulfide isomerase/thioredoxin